MFHHLPGRNLAALLSFVSFACSKNLSNSSSESSESVSCWVLFSPSEAICKVDESSPFPCEVDAVSPCESACLFAGGGGVLPYPRVINEILTIPYLLLGI